METQSSAPGCAGIKHLFPLLGLSSWLSSRIGALWLGAGDSCVYNESRKMGINSSLPNKITDYQYNSCSPTGHQVCYCCVVSDSTDRNAP